MTGNFDSPANWDIAIIVVAYEGDAWIPSCMESLQSSTKVNALVLLVDNKDNTKLKSEKLGTLTVESFKTPHPMGFADANNFALMKVPPSVPYICFLNQDTISQKNWLEIGLQCLNQHPRIGGVSPMLKNYQGTGWDHDFQNSLRNQPGFDESWLKDPSPKFSTTYHDVEEVPATAMIVRTDVIKQTGPFDPIFGSYYEDYDLCMRIRHLGYRLAFCHFSIIHHYSGSISQTKKARKRRSRWVIRNRTIHTIRKATDPRWKLLLQCMVLGALRQIIRAIMRTPSSAPLQSVLLAYLDLIQVLPRLISNKIDRNKWEDFLTSIRWDLFTTQSFQVNENSSR